MKRPLSLIVLALMPILASCAFYQAAGEIQRGRPQLMYGDPQVALAHFQRASEIDQNYVMRLRAFDEGVWTYVGRAQYASGRLTEARRALDGHCHKTAMIIWPASTLVWCSPRAKTVGAV